jgi:hypothetical protein
MAHTSFITCDNCENTSEGENNINYCQECEETLCEQCFNDCCAISCDEPSDWDTKTEPGLRFILCDTCRNTSASVTINYCKECQSTLCEQCFNECCEVLYDENGDQICEWEEQKKE